MTNETPNLVAMASAKRKRDLEEIDKFRRNMPHASKSALEGMIKEAKRKGLPVCASEEKSSTSSLVGCLSAMADRGSKQGERARGAHLGFAVARRSDGWGCFLLGRLRAARTGCWLLTQ